MDHPARPCHVCGRVCDAADLALHFARAHAPCPSDPDDAMAASIASSTGYDTAGRPSTELNQLALASEAVPHPAAPARNTERSATCGGESWQAQ